MGLAVVPGQDFAGFPGPVWEGALAYLAAGDRKVGDGHGESPGRWLAHHLLWCQSRRGGHAVPCAGRHVHGVRDTGLARYGAVSCGGIADGGWGRRSPGRLSLPGAAGPAPFRARHPVLLVVTGLPGAPPGAAPGLASAANGSRLAGHGSLRPPPPFFFFFFFFFFLTRHRGQLVALSWTRGRPAVDPALRRCSIRAGQISL